MTTDFNLDSYSIIEKGIRLSGGNPTQFEELDSARISLNLMQQEWSTRGVNLWKVEPMTVTVSASTVDVPLDPSVLDVVSLVIRTSTSTSVGPLFRDYIAERIGHKDYIEYTNKSQQGRPVQYVMQRLKENPVVTLWPMPEDDKYLLNMWVLKKFNDINSLRDYGDFPAKSLPAITMGLGYYLGMERSDGSQGWEAKLTRLKGEYDRLWGLAFDEDDDSVNLSIKPKMNK